jgi:hypothetical protein
MNAAVDISFCILNYNQVELLRECLESCLREIDASRLVGELIVIDNGSSDGSADMVRRLFPQVQLIARTTNGGFAEVNNEAIGRSLGRYLFILNEDTALLPGCLQRLTSYMDAHPETGLSGPRILNTDRSVQLGYHRRLPGILDTVFTLVGLQSLWRGNPITARANYSKELSSRTEAFPIEQVAGCAMFMRRDVLAAITGFDEKFHFWYEDVDLCRRIADAGWAISCVPAAELVHHGGVSVRQQQVALLIVWRTESLLRYFRTHSSPKRYAAVRVAVALAITLRLPVAAFMSFSPKPATRRRWAGSTQAYFGTLMRIARSGSD